MAKFTPQNSQLQSLIGVGEVAPRIQERPGTSVWVQTPDNTKIDMTSVVARISPILNFPGLLMAVRNTNAEINGTGQNVSVIYRKQFLQDTQTWISYDETTQEHKAEFDALHFTAEDDPFKAPIISAIRLNPKLNIARRRLVEWDKGLMTVGSVLGRSLANYILQRDAEKQQEAFDDLYTSVKEINAALTGAPTTFKTGAHIEKATGELTPDLAYNAVGNARSSVVTWGYNNAPGADNKAYKGAKGISPNDLILLTHPTFDWTLRKTPGLYASWKGFDMLGALEFNRIGYIDSVLTPNLPEHVLFMLITNGANGTIGYERIGRGTGGDVFRDPAVGNLAFRLVMYDQYVLGSVFPFQALIYVDSTTPDFHLKDGQMVRGILPDGSFGLKEYKGKTKPVVLKR